MTACQTSKGGDGQAMRGQRLHGDPPLPSNRPHPLIAELRRAREEQGVTQVQMADHLGVTQSSVSRLERSGDALISTLVRYGALLGVRIEVTHV